MLILISGSQIVCLLFAATYSPKLVNELLLYTECILVLNFVTFIAELETPYFWLMSSSDSLLQFPWLPKSISVHILTAS